MATKVTLFFMQFSMKICSFSGLKYLKSKSVVTPCFLSSRTAAENLRVGSGIQWPHFMTHSLAILKRLDRMDLNLIN